jgi:hypothetical protein
MQITPQILNIPPYLSTTWDNISTLKPEISGKSYILIVTLKNGEQVTIPSLSEVEVKEIFVAHAKSVEVQRLPALPKFPMPFTFTLPSKQEGPVSSLGDAMRHNPEQSDLPEIPPEVLNRVSGIVKAFGFEDFSALEEAKPDCNCMYCQLQRTLVPVQTIEEKIKDEDLHFRDWEVKEVSEKLYTVTSPLDADEHYNVYLGEPLGCTCGQKNCEHIKAVLHS